MRPGTQRLVAETSGLLLDTHVWIWLMEQDDRLHLTARQAIDRAAQGPYGVHISAISTWEVGMLAVKDRIRLSMAPLDWVQTALAQRGVRLLPLSPEVAIASTNLPGSFHGDPADRMLVASCRLHDLALVTADSRILEYGQGHHLKVLKASSPQG